MPAGTTAHCVRNKAFNLAKNCWRLEFKLTIHALANVPLREEHFKIK